MKYSKLLIFVFLLAVGLVAQNPPLQVAGLYDALSFGYGVGNVSGLKVATGNRATGNQTITLNSNFVTLQGGLKLFPIATNTPLTVGSGANAETVTPITANCATATCSITAVFANIHAIGEPVSSGSFGLYEAINYVNGIGGSVVVSGAWVSAGGTTSIYNAAPSIAGVLTLDNRTGLVVGGGGGGGLQPPPAAGIVTGTNGSTTTGVIAATKNDSIFSLSFGTGSGNAAVATGQGNFSFGYNAGAALTVPSSGAQPAANVFMGYEAGLSATSARESVAIGYEAMMQYTGSAGGAEDGLMVCIGSLTCSSQLAQAGISGASVAIGQKAAANATSITGSVIIGAHGGLSLGTVGNCVLIGKSVVDDSTSTGDASCTNSAMVGSGAASGIGLKNADSSLGYLSLAALTTGVDDVAVGYTSGQSMTSGASNTLIGSQTGAAFTTQTDNTCSGYIACKFATGGFSAVYGSQAGSAIFTQPVTLFGYQAGKSLTSAIQSTFVGAQAGQGATTANYNTLLGFAAGFHNVSGASNVILGSRTAPTCTSCSSSILIGDDVDTGAATTNVIAIGSSNSVSNTVVLGNSSIVTTTEYGVHVSGSTPGVFSALPTAASMTRGCTWISDGSAVPVYMANTAGGGSVLQLTCSNGTNWLNH